MFGFLENGKNLLIPNQKTWKHTIPCVVTFNNKERLIGKAIKSLMSRNFKIKVMI
jgi:molecular chaperone DnaK (HSP70)